MHLRHLIALAAAITISGFFTACEDSDTTEAFHAGEGLKTLYMQWSQDGRPMPPNTGKYIRSNLRHFFNYTNTINAGTNVFHCRFGATSEQFRRHGILAITDEHVLIWIGEDKKVVVSPESKLHFDH